MFQVKILIYFSTSQEKYLEYFAWKDKYDLYNYDPWCQLCEKLHDPNEPIKIYPDMSEWFYYDQNHVPLCSDGSEQSYFPSMFGADA